MKFFSWIAGFFEDQSNNASRKAAALYISFGLLYMLVKGSLDGKVINDYILYTVVIIILFCLGAITAEYLVKMRTPFDKKDETNK